MKKITALLLLAACLFAFASCGDAKKTTAPQTTAPQTTAPSAVDPTAGADVGFDFYGADMSLYCTLSPSDYTALSLSLDVTDAEIDEYITDLLRWNPREIILTDRAVKKGDLTYIYYTGYVDGVAFSGGSNASSAEPYALVIGSGAFIPGFEDAMIGMIPSETSKEDPQPITVTFPDNYSTAELAGKEAVFEIYLVGISGGFVPRSELTAEFITETLGYKTEESDVVAAYRAELKAQMKADAEENYESRRNTAIIDALRAAADSIVCPESELARYEKLYTDTVKSYYDYYYMYGYVSNLDEMGRMYFGLGDGADWKLYLKELCVDIVEEYVLIYAVAESAGITVTKAELTARLESIAASNNMTAADVLAQAGRDYIYNSVVYDKVMDLILSSAVIDNGTLTPKSNG